MHRILWGLAGAIVLLDILWAAAAHFNFDRPAYLFIAETALGLGALAFFYGYIRRDERLCAMLSGTAFLTVFSAAFSALNYMLLTVAGPRIDASLALVDAALGFDWTAVMTFMAHHPILNLVLQCCYVSVLPQIAVLVLALGWARRSKDVFGFCVSVAVGAFVTVVFWTCFPSFGAFSVYHLPAGVASHLNLALDGKYADDLVHLLATGPGQISPRSARGLIGFPSYHAALAAIATWYALPLKYLRWPVIALNSVVMVATPIQGGHFLIDVVAGLAVAALAVATAERITSAANNSEASASASPPRNMAGKVAQN